MKSVGIVLFTLLMLLTTVSAASVDGSWQPNGAMSKTIDDGQSATFDWYAYTTWSNLYVTIKLYDGETPIHTYVEGYQLSTYVGDEITVLPSQYDGSGDYEIRMTANDNMNYFSTQTLSLHVSAVQQNVAPTIQPIAHQYVDEDTSIAIQVQADDADGDTLSYSLSTAATFLSIDQDGRITGTAPAVHQDTDYDVQVSVNDGNGHTVSRTFTLTVQQVNQAPSIAPVSDREVDEGSAFSVTLQVSDPDLYDTVTCGVKPGTSLPNWLSLNGCTVSGTAPMVQQDTDYDVSIRASDNHGAFDDESFIVTVVDTNQAPLAAYSYSPASPLARTEVSFTDRSTDDGTISDWSWDFDDGSSSALRNPRHTFSNMGSYDVRLTVTDDHGVSSWVEHTVTVTDKTFSRIDVDANVTNGDAPLKVGFSCSAYGGDGTFTYSWDFGDNTLGSTQQNPTHVYQLPGDYTARCTATDANQDTISGSVTVHAETPNLPPEMEPVNHQYVDELDSFTYELQVSDPDNTYSELECYDATAYGSEAVNNDIDAVMYLPDWLVLNGCTLSGDAPEVVNDLDYPIRVGVRDPEGLFDEEEFVITVQNVNHDPVIVPVPDHDVVEGSSYRLNLEVSDPDGDEVTCSVTPHTTLPVWLSLTSCSLSGTAPFVLENTDYPVSVRASDGNGGTDDESFIITVVDTNSAPVAAFSYDPLNPLAGDIISFADESTDDGEIVEWLWDFDDGFTTDVRNPNHVFDWNGFYDVRLTVTDDHGVSSWVEHTIIVTDNAFTRIDVDANVTDGDAPLKVGFSCTAYGGDDPLVYYWNFGDGVESLLQNPVHVYDAAGVYDAECVVEDATGDIVQGSVSVSVHEPFVNHDPVIVPVPDHDVVEGSSYRLDLEVSDPDGDEVLCSVTPGSVLPGWLVLSGCSLFGTAPFVLEDSDFSVSITATDEFGATDEESFIITVVDTNSPPEADFVYVPLAPLAGDLVTFEDRSTDDGEIVAWSWDFDDGSTSSGQNPVHTFAEAGDYAVSLTVTDDHGIDDSVERVVTVTDEGFTKIKVNANVTQGDAPLKVGFSCIAYGGDNPVSYAWTFGDNTSSSGQVPIHTYENVGVYVATCMATDATGDTISGSVTIMVDEPFVNHAPIMQPVADHEVDELTRYELQLQVSDPDGDELTCFSEEQLGYGEPLPYWLSLDTEDCVLSGDVPEVDEDVIELIEVGVRDPYGANDSIYYYLLVKNVLNDPLASFDWDPFYPVVDEWVFFDSSTSHDDDGEIVAWSWDFGDGSSSMLRNPVHAYAAPGDYDVSLTVTDNDGLTDSALGTITVSPEEIIVLDEFGCNPDVVRGHLQYCSVHVVDENGDDAEGVDVSMVYTDPSRMVGVGFGDCTTDFKGFCHVEAVVDEPHAWYTLEATAEKDGLFAGPLYETFQVWDKRYEVRDLEVYEDRLFTHSQDTFYRGEDLYAEFTIFDMISEQYVCDDDLVQEMFLRVNNEDPLYLEELEVVRNNHCAYHYGLDMIPLSDEYLGDGRVFAFTFNFSDETAGQASKEVTVLNNPLLFDLPDKFWIDKETVDDEESITLDLRSFAADIETPLDEIVFDVSVDGDLVVTRVGPTVYRFTSPAGHVTDTVVSVVADDTDGSVVQDEMLIRINILYVPPVIVLDGFSCNSDVVRGRVQRCSIHAADDSGNDLENAGVTMTYEDGEQFGVCVTDFKGYCHVDAVVDREAGVYVIEATAAKDGYVPPPEPLSDEFRVWEERYEVRNLEVYGKPDFLLPVDTFYRGEDMYAEFTVYDEMTGQYVCDDDLVREVFLRVDNADPLQFVEWQELVQMEMVGPSGLDRVLSVFGAESSCSYRYGLDMLPLSDEYLGDGRVFAFAFNFSDETAGQSSKMVTVLNNPVSVDVPEAVMVHKVRLDLSGSATLDVSAFVDDVETAPEDMVYDLEEVTDSGILVEDLGLGVFRFTSPASSDANASFRIIVDDSDGSSATDLFRVIVLVDVYPEPPVAVAGPDRSVVEGGSVSLDGSASYDPDGGDIISYVWDFGDGRSGSGVMTSVSYDDEGAYLVTLTVTDDEGENDSDTLLVTVTKEPYVAACSNGLDDDSDGLIDMDDPGCSSPNDPSEYNRGFGGPEDGLQIVSISTYTDRGYELAVPGDVVVFEVVLENEGGVRLEDMRVSAAVPELGVKAKGSQFSLRPGQRTTRTVQLYLPFDAPAYDYYTEIGVANDDLRRSTHRMLEVVDR